MVDLSHEWHQRNEMLRIKRETLEQVNEVVNKQMHVAQEIAGLLGETTAETKSVCSNCVKCSNRRSCSMNYFLDIAQLSVNKFGEELCGDRVKVLRTEQKPGWAFRWAGKRREKPVFWQP
jgi:hypothetical protein